MPFSFAMKLNIRNKPSCYSSLSSVTEEEISPCHHPNRFHQCRRPMSAYLALSSPLLRALSSTARSIALEDKHGAAKSLHCLCPTPLATSPRNLYDQQSSHIAHCHPVLASSSCNMELLIQNQRSHHITKRAISCCYC